MPPALIATRRRAALAALLVLALAAGALAEAAPWRRRRRPDIRPSRRSLALVEPGDWPAEPPTPASLDPERFAEALKRLCGWMPPGRATRYGAWMREYGAEMGVDPFLLGALSHRMGRCRPDADELSGLGLTLISRRQHGDHLRRGVYRYWVRQGDGWDERTLPAGRFPFSDHQLRRAQANLYFAAVILRVLKEQEGSLRGLYEHHPHRHYVSHWVWGDWVKSDRSEDRILTDRRRMLEYYGAHTPMAPRGVRGLAMSAPLDGAPRVVSSWIGAARDEGARRHRGVDVESVLGEPVLAVAAGRVNFAGVDLPGHRSHAALSRREIEAVPRDELGAGGRYVCVLHHPEEGADAPAWTRSCYMHLEDVEVRHGQRVARGERLGTVGRTGMRRSAPHLHLELHGPDGLLDASALLSGFLIGRNPD
ncbi:MAG: M23 family metallopeptidase [Myxococcota bacterium]